MARAYKWIGGIGYILTLIPYVNLIALVLVAIAWIMMGRDRKQTIFTATGILMIITFVMSIALTGVVFTIMPGFMPRTMRPPLEMPPTEYLKNIFAFAGILVAIGLATAIIGLAGLIAEIISHFRAAEIFQNTWFKVGGWLRIATIVVAVIAIPIMIFTIMSAPEMFRGILPGMMAGNFFTILMRILWPILIAAILGLLATIFSIIAFFTIPEEMPA